MTTFRPLWSILAQLCLMWLWTACGNNGGSGNESSMGGGTSTSGGGGSQSDRTSTGGALADTVTCTFDAHSTLSTAIPTVAIVEWSTSLADPSSAHIFYSLNGAASNVLNNGGTAPVDLSQANNRTLLLGLKGSSTYTFRIQAQSSTGDVCTSPDYTITTGAVASSVPALTQSIKNFAALSKGFIVTSSGTGGGMGGGAMGGGAGASVAYIFDADGSVVWWAAAPASCSRARMDYEGANMWMLALNVQNSGGEMRYVSMDGLTGANNVSGLSSGHHDFAVLPGGAVAIMSWSSSGSDVQSDLIERYADGTSATLLRIGPSLYLGGQSVIGASTASYHSNSISYHVADDTYTIGDRNPNLYVKVTHGGQPLWQIGGSCSGAPAPKCAGGSWKVNHGHDIAANGNFLLFNNTQTGASHAIELKLAESSSSLSTSIVEDYVSSDNAGSNTLGDVQRLPNGNTLVTFSTCGVIQELDASWNVVRTFTAGSFGYADWRETLYGPPTRL